MGPGVKMAVALLQSPVCVVVVILKTCLGVVCLAIKMTMLKG